MKKGKNIYKPERSSILVLAYYTIVQITFYFLMDHGANSDMFENQIRLKPLLGMVGRMQPRKL